MKPIFKYLIIAGILTLTGVGIFIFYGNADLEKNRIWGEVISTSEDTVNVVCSTYEKESKCNSVGDNTIFNIKVPSNKKYRDGDTIYFKYNNGKARYCYIQNIDKFVLSLCIILIALPFVSLSLYGFEYGLTKNKKIGFIGMVIFDLAVLLSFIGDSEYILISQIVLMAITFLLPLMYSKIIGKKGE